MPTPEFLPDPTRATLPPALRAAAARGAGGFTYVDGAQVEHALPLSELLSAASRIAGGLRRAGVAAGTPVLLQLDHGLRFVTGFWGAVLAGAVPAPLSLPESFEGDGPGVDKLVNVSRVLGAGAALLTDAANAEDLRRLRARESAVPEVHVLEALATGEPAPDYAAEPDALALLMFSSGSTGLPKGIELTHGNLLHNVRQLAARCRLSPSDRSATWLPYSHDMGLVLFHLTHLVVGIAQWKVDPLSFLVDPLAFLRLLERRRITLTGWPNFAYDHLLRRVPREALSTLDLSSVRAIFNGAEPISPVLCREFTEALAPTRLRRDAILPGFGIAEACVCATAYPFEAAGRRDLACPSLFVDREALAAGEVCPTEPVDGRTLELANLGPPLDGMDVLVVGADGNPLPEGRVGSLLIRGPNVTRGFRGRPGDVAVRQDGAVDTGDLGFLWRGDVFISGRKKDVVFVNGLNYFSHDLEALVQAATGLPAGDVAVCATRTKDQRRERIAIFVRAPRLRPELLEGLARARSQLARRINHRIDAIVPLLSLPRTTSGKIQRHKLAQELADGVHDDRVRRTEVALLAHRVPIPPAGALEEALLAACLRAGATVDPCVETPLVELLGDSLRLAQAVVEIHRSGAHPDCGAVGLPDLADASVRSLAARLERGEVRPSTPPLRRAPDDERAPSRGQRDLLFWEAFDGGNARYHEAYACALKGPVTLAALRAAVEAVVERNSTLRTVFPRLPSGGHVQRILPALTIEWEELPAGVEEPAALERFAALAARPFDLGRGPLHRFAAQALPDGGARLLLVFHHLIIDGLAIGVLLRQLEQACSGAPLPPEGIRPADVHGWIDARRALPEHAEAAAHWRDVLQDGEAPARIGREPEGPELPAIVRELAVDGSRLEAWLSHAEALGMTPFQLSLAAFILLLSERTGAAAPLTSVTAPGRSHPEAQELVGYLSTTLAVRLDVAACRNLADVAAAVKAQAAAVLRHQDFPLSEFAPRTERPAPPYATAFSFMPSPVGSLAALTGRVHRLRGLPKLDLALSIETRADGWTFVWEGDARRVSAADLAAWHAGLCALLDAFAEGPAFPVSLLHLRGAHRELPAISRSTPRKARRFQRVTDAFEAAATARPDAEALLDEAGAVSYGELRRTMDGLAGILRAEGLRPGERALVVTGKGRRMIQSVLGVVKAGAAYVPCDADMPEDRLRRVLAQARPIAILCDAEQARRLSAIVPAGVKRLCLDEPPPDAGWRGGLLREAEAAPEAFLEPVTRADDPVYLHFTSGSTGEPKGILDSHEAVCHLVEWFLDAGRYRPGDTVPQLVSFAFEAFAAELFPALAAGARLYCPPPLRLLAPAELAQRLAAASVSVATVSPSFAVQLARGVNEAGLREKLPLRALLFGGEALLPSHVGAVRGALGARVELVNLYGPTEATVHATAWTVPAEVGDVRIGVPLPGKKAAVVGPGGFVLGEGEPGEIWLGGAGLALGYWDDPERTRRAFPTLELSPGRPERFYRTGDLGLVEADGQLRFLGRLDAQVKVHGHRVELEEVDRALAAEPGVSEACAVVEEHGPGQHRLVGFYTGPSALDPAALRAALARRLPAYMVPSRYVHLPALPVTRNAKVDRRALAGLVSAPDDPRAVAADHDALREAWRKLLGSVPASEDADFFASGGDSILAMELCAELTARGHRVGPKDVYANPRFGALAAHLRAATAPPAAPEEGVVTGSVALTPIQHWFLDRPLARSSHWLQSRAFRLRGAIDEGALRAALLALVNHHDQLRAVFTQTRRGVAQRVREPWNAFPLAARDAGADAAQAGSDLAQELVAAIQLGACTFAAGLIREAGGALLVLAAHHLVVDNVSWLVLARDLEAAYEAAREGRRPSLAPRSRSFQRHADALTEEADAPGFSARWIPAWRPVLEASTETFAPAPLERYHASRLDLGAEDTARLLARLGKARPQDLALSLLGRALRALGHDELLVDVEGHGRTGEADLSRTVGWLTVLYPLCLSVKGGSAADLLAKAWRLQRRWAEDGRTWGMLRYLSGDPAALEAFRSAPTSWINLNHLGQLDRAGAPGPLEPAASPVPLFAPEDPPPYALVVQSFLAGGSLAFELGLHPELAARWGAEALEAALRAAAWELSAELEALPGPSPLRFDAVELGAAEAAELPGDALDAYPMTPMHEAMVFHCHEHPDSAAYHEQTLYRWRGALDRERLERALALVVARHEGLRTVYRIVGGRRPLQIVLPARPVRVEEEVVEGAGDGTPPTVRRYLEEDRRAGRFDPGEWPLFRLRLFRVGEASQLAFSFHHVVLDGWSQAALMAELLGHYRDLEQGRSPEAGPLASGMRDHVARLARVVADPGAQAFWARELSSPPLLALPLDRVRPDQRTLVGEKVALLVPREVVSAIEGLAQSWGVTFNAVCLGTWAWFLGALGGEEDVVTGVVSAGRFPDLPDGLKLLGCFLNTLPVRLRFDPEAATLEDVSKTAQAFLNASRPFDAFPLKEIVRLAQESDPEQRSRDLFQYLYAFENYPTEASESLGLELIDGYDMTSYDLTAVLVKRGGTLRMMFEYAPDVILPATAKRWLDTYATMLERLVRSPSVPAARLDLRPPDQVPLLEAYNATRRDYDLDRTLDALVAAQAERTPDAVAVVDRGGALTYRALDTDANRLAGALQEAGVGAGTRVAVIMPRRRDAVTAFLAVLKAGGTYVPIDPTYPPERIGGILEDATIAFAVTCREALESRAELRARLGAVPNVYLMDEAADGLRGLDRRTWGARRDVRAACPARPRDLAYVIFTSGSTGKPKGVMATHRGAVNTICGINELIGLGAADAVLGFSSYSFDLSVWDMFGALAAGARLVVATEADIQDSDRLFQWMEETGTTVWDSVPTGMSQLVRALLLRADPPRSAKLRAVMLSGEFIPVSLPTELERIFPAARVWSLGGATEGTIWSIFHPIEEIDPAWPSIPYGRPLPNQGYYALTPGLAPCVVDQVGMLYIVGEGVAAGYFDDPEKTARAFIPDPLRPGPGETIYRTGDIGRFRGDGNLEILGRKDGQVKVRGFRIELGEVETHLSRAPGVRDAAAIVVKEGGHSRLLAFFTSNDPKLDGEALTAFLRGRLPEYMIPSRFQRLEALPVNTSGKLDRKRLPSLLERTAPAAGAGGELSGPTERAIAAAWCKTLGLEKLGPADNFFRLGGDSIMSLQVASTLAAAGFSIRPADLVRHPTVRELARFVEFARPVPAESASTAALAAGPAQRWFLERLAVEKPDYWHLSMELLLPPNVATERVQGAIEQLVRRHEVLRWAWSSKTGAFQALAEPRVPLEEVHASDADAEGAWRSLAIRVRQAIRIEGTLPLLALGLLRSPSGDRLLWIVHHLLVDGVSWRTLLEELSALLERPDAALPPVGSSYAAWARKVQELAPSLTPLDLAPWREYHSTSWPEPFPGATPGREGEAERAVGALPAARTPAFLTGVHGPLGTQPLDLLVAALLLAVRELSGQHRLALELEHHGRDLAADGLDLSRTVGWFTAFYPLPIEVPDDPVEAVIRVKDAQRLLGARAAEHLAWELAQQAPRSHPQVLLNYLGNLDRVSIAPGVRPCVLGAPDRAPENARSHAVEVGAWVAGGDLQWSVAASIGGVAARLAERLGHHLETVIEACAAAAPRRTRGDFPLLAPDDHLLEQLQDDVEDAYPPSAMLLAMHLHAKAYPGTSMYHVWGVATMKLALDVECLEEALNRVIQRCEIMRSVLREDAQGQPALAVLEVPRYRIRVVEGMEPEEFFRDVDPVVLDTSRWPNFQILVSRIAPDTYHLLEFFQHFVLDGWSNALLFSQIMHEYQRLLVARNGGAAVPPVEPYPMRYRDFVAHQLRAARDPAALAYWREELVGATAAALPPDLPRKAERTFRTVITEFPLEPSLLAQLREHGRRIGCTLSDLLLGGLALLSHRLTGSHDFTLGYCTSIRPSELPGSQGAVGMFLNTLPLRLRWSEGLGVEDAFAVWRRQLAGCRSHEEMPLTRIIEATRDRCDVFRTGGLKVLYTSEVYPPAQLPPDAVGITAYNWHMTEFDFALVYSSDTPMGVVMKLAYADDLYRPATIAAWFDLYQDGLRALVGAAPRRPRSAAVPAAPTLFAERWAERVRTAPHAPAVIAERTLRAAELDARARAVAAGVEVAPERPLVVDVAAPDRVGIALVACLCGGQPFVLLDAEEPADARRAAAAAVAGTGARVLTDRPRDWRGDFEVLDLGRLAEGAPLERWPGPDGARWAYLNLTSGTTGAPRAVVVSHASLGAFLDWYGPALALAPRDRLSHLLSRSFDAALSEWLPALVSGGAVAAGRPLAELAPHRLSRELEERAVTIVTLPASYFDLWSREREAPPASLRAVVVGGAPLRAESVRRWRARCAAAGRDIPVVNVYGPAEATIGVCAHAVEPGDLEAGQVFVPVGRVGPGLEVVGLEGEPVVAGQPGELRISGPQLMAGTWNGTAIEPRAHQPFTSGDVATVSPDGRVIVFGRKGDWVKVRGRRLHLRESEAQIARDAGLAQVVLGLDRRRPDARVVAWCVDPEERPARTLRRLVAASLPCGVVPTVHRVASIPLGSHGKPDLRALEQLASEDCADLTRIAPPRSLAWSLLEEAMGPEIPEPDAGFYENGGNSLQALHLQSLLARRLGLDVPLEQILEARCLADLAEELEARRTERAR